MNSSDDILCKHNSCFAQEVDIEELIVTVLYIIFKMVVTTFLGLLAMSVNVINIAVFYKMGLSDGVTQNFFILSISDGFSGVVYSTSSVSYVLLFFIRTYIGYGSLEILVQKVYWGSYMAAPFPFLISTSATLVIAVVRCCCVVMPLKVKHIITARRQLAAILFVSGIAVSVLGSSFSAVQLVLVRNPYTNVTGVLYKDINWARYTVVCYVILFGGYVVLSATIVILSVSLRRAAKFREGSTLESLGSQKHDKTFADSTSAQKPKSNGKERDSRIVRIVLFICIIFVACTIPSVLFFAFRLFFPGVSPYGKYKFLYEIVLLSTEPSALVNATTNFLIYFNFNSRYQSTFKALFAKNNTPH